MKRSKSPKWWLESAGFLVVLGGFLLYQGKSWSDLSELKAIAVAIGAELIRSRLRGEE